MVPKILHQIVGPKTNAIIDHCLSSWQMLKRIDFTIRIWNDDLLEKFLAEKYPFALEAFLHARNHAEAADIARYLLVYDTGGYYMDWDVQLLDLHRFVALAEKAPKGFLIQDPANQSIASEAFAAARHEPYLMALSRDIINTYEAGLREVQTTPYYSGPFRMRESLLMSSTEQSIFPVKELFVYDYEEIREMPDREPEQPMIHYWLHSWIK